MSLLLPQPIPEGTYLGDDIFELPFLPCIGGMIHHGDYGIIIFFILVIQEHQLCPKMSLFCSSQHLHKKDWSLKL